MKLANTRLKKTILIIAASIFVMIVIVIACISPITKYLVEKYDEKYTGRQITMGWAYVNPFTGYVYFRNLKIYEYKSDSIMLSANGVGGYFALLKLFSRTYEIKKLVLDKPRGIIIQENKEFNFSDIIRKFSEPNPDTKGAPSYFNILNIKINDGILYYREKLIPVNYFVKKVNIESKGMWANADTIVFNFSFLSGPSNGGIKGNMTVNFKTLDYHYDVVVKQLDLKPIEQYLKDMTNYGYFSAILDADVKATGNFKNGEDVTLNGLMAISDFHFQKSPGNDYASFSKLVLDMKELSPKNQKYIFDSISLSHPYFKYEQYDYLDNIERVFGKNGANISAVGSDPAKFNLVVEIARYVKVLAQNFFHSYYNINRLAIYDGDFQFNDYSLSEKFSIAANPLFIVADSIDKNHERVGVSFHSGIKPYGDLSVTLSINPKDSTDFDIHYHLQKLPITIFNPYIISSTSFPLDRGTLELNGNWKVRNEIIQSDNHLLIIDPRVTVRVKNKDASRLPLPLIMSFVRERGNVIDYEIPITGNLKDPNFHFRDVIFDLVENILIKPPTTPYRMEVKSAENEIEKLQSLQWQMREDMLQDNPGDFVKSMVDFLIKNPQASINVRPMLYDEKEKEYILFYAAKKKYYLSGKNENAILFSEADSVKVDKMSIKDSLFVKYLNMQVKDSMMFTVQEKCNKLIGTTSVTNQNNQLNKERENAFISYFRKGGVDNRVKMHPAETIIPYNGFSFYQIDYNGEIPASLSKAYLQMSEWNNESPRNKFKNEREKTKITP